MANLENIELDVTLHDLIQKTPSSNLKLIAAWDGLSVETQIKIILLLKNKAPNKILDKILLSTNEYIRYLGTKYNQTRWNEDIVATEKECALVKYSDGVNQVTGKDDCSLFFLMPHEGQIITISSWSTPENFSDLIQWAIIHKPITQHQLDELVEEFVNNKSILNYFMGHEIDGWIAHTKGKQLDSLWSLVPKLGVTESAKSLVFYLPLESDLSCCLDDEFLESLDPDILANFLYRKDVYFLEFRKKCFFSSDETRNKYKLQVQNAAASSNLLLTEQEFHGLIESKKFDLIEILVMNNSYRPAVPPVFLSALCDIGEVFIENYYYYSKDKKQLILEFFKSSYYENYDIDFAEEKKIQDTIEVVLYEIACRALPWKKSSGEDDNNTQFSGLFKVVDESWHSSPRKRLIEFFDDAEFILKNKDDPWAIYMALSSFFRSKKHMCNMPSKIKDFDSFIDDALCIPETFVLNFLQNESPKNCESPKELNNTELKLDELNEEIKNIKKEMEFYNDSICEKLKAIPTEEIKSIQSELKFYNYMISEKLEELKIISTPKEQSRLPESFYLVLLAFVILVILLY